MTNSKMEYTNLWAYLDLLDYTSYKEYPEYRCKYYARFDSMVRIEDLKDGYIIRHVVYPILLFDKSVHTISKNLIVKEQVLEFNRIVFTELFHDK